MCYAPGLAKSTVCTICDNDEQIMENAKSETPLLNYNAATVTITYLNVI
jgi:hypothetical protein